MREMEKRLGVVWITEILIACGFTGQLDSKMIEKWLMYVLILCED